MKKLIIILLSLGLATGVYAQHHVVVGGGGYHYYVRPSVRVGLGYAPFYPYYGFGFGYYPFAYYPLGYPYPPGYGYYRPSKLSMQIEDIKNDYHDKIVSVRHDKSLTHAERKEKVHELKQERDQKITDTKSNYYKH
ncbi:MAG TPA: hypothetical protein VMH01_05210 [Puia sp.]|nr:hypothetical protein [Puia sp.]